MSRKQNSILSVKEVARMCHVSNETIRRWIRKNGLAAKNTEGGLAIKIEEQALRQFAEELNVYVDWEYLDEIRPEATAAQ